MMNQDECKPGWRAPYSAVVGIGWLVFIILWLFFYASEYSWEKNIAIFLLSILVTFLLIGDVWAVWGLRKVPREGWEMMRVTGFKWRIGISILLPFLAMIFLIVWFWFYAEPYTWYQNVAIIIVTILILGGIIGGMWSYWSSRHGDKFDKMEKMGEEIAKKFDDKEDED